MGQPLTQFARYTLIGGSRAEGVVIYQDANNEPTQIYSHHDTDPARGASNAFDLVRKHKFGHLDAEVSAGTPINEYPSYAAMVQFARSLPEVQAQLIEEEFETLPPVEVYTDAPAAKDRKARFRVIPAEEFAIGPPLAWIIKGILPRAEVGVIFGEPGAGKSFFALDVAAAVTRGEDWQDLKTTAGRAIYICAEGAGGFRKRMNAYAQKHGVALTHLPGVVADAPNLLEVEQVLGLTREIVAQGTADLIVVDTLSASTPGGDENSGEDMGKMLQHCKGIHRATGALVLLIHHTGKDTTKGARGHSSLKGAADVMIEVTRNGDYRLATIYKMKDGEEGQTWNFKLHPVVLGIDEDGDEITSCVIEMVAPPANSRPREPQGSLAKAMLAAVKNFDGPMEIKDLFDETVEQMPFDKGKRDQRRNIAKRTLDKLLVQGFLYLDGSERLTTHAAATATAEDFDSKEQE